MTDCDSWWNGWSWFFIFFVFFIFILILFIPWQYSSSYSYCAEPLPPERHGKRPMVLVVEDDSVF